MAHTILHYDEGGCLVLDRLPQTRDVLMPTDCFHDAQLSFNVRYLAATFQQQLIVYLDSVQLVGLLMAT